MNLLLFPTGGTMGLLALEKDILRTEGAISLRHIFSFRKSGSK